MACIGPRNPFSQHLHSVKYRQQGETFDDYCVRYARTTADDESHFRDLVYCLRTQAILPAGRQQRAVGWPFQTTAFNCFVGNTIPDDTKGIGDALTNSMLTLRSGGGCGWDFSTLRPHGDLIKGLGEDAYASGPVSFMGMWNAMCSTIRSAGERRGAMMGVLRIDHPDVMRFVRAKRNERELTNFNISVGVTNHFMECLYADSLFPLTFNNRVYGEVRASDLWAMIMESNWDWAEPGVLFLDTINRMNPLGYCETISATNPCVTGDTLVAVAGRGAIPIKQLAKEGKDVPVYAVNPQTGETVVRWGRNPRKTGRKAPLVKVTLDDGSVIRCTPNHKFPLLDGRKVEAYNLQPGDSLFRFDLYRPENGDPTVKGKREYHLIVEAKYGRKFNFGSKKTDYHVHHIDGNHSNNSWENLEVKTASDHTRDHMLGEDNPMRWWWQTLSNKEKEDYRRKMRESTSGDRNGMWGKNHSEETLKKIGEKTSERFKNKQFSNKHRAAVVRAMTPEVKESIRQKAIARYSSFHKVCLYCHEQFTVRAVSEATGKGRRKFCSRTCAATFRNTGASLPVNHKVVSVEQDGYGDVYNLTVDEFHNYAVVTSETKDNRYGGSRVSGVKICNCGEQPLPPNGACLLLSLNMVRYLVPTWNTYPTSPKYTIDYDRFIHDVDVAVRACDNVFEKTVYPLASQKEEALNKRRMGVGVTGVANALEICGLTYATEPYLHEQGKILERLRNTAYMTSIQMADKKGSFPLFDADKWLASGFAQTLPDYLRDEIKDRGLRNGLLLSIAPTGTISLCADNVSSGIEPPYVLEQQRLVHLAGGRMEVSLNDYAYEEYGISGKTAMETSAQDHVRVLTEAQKYVDSSISKTVNVNGAKTTPAKPGEITFTEFKDLYLQAYYGGAKGCTTFNANGRRTGIITERVGTGSPDREGKADEQLCYVDPNTGQRTCG